MTNHKHAKGRRTATQKTPMIVPSNNPNRQYCLQRQSLERKEGIRTLLNGGFLLWGEEAFGQANDSTAILLDVHGL